MAVKTWTQEDNMGEAAGTTTTTSTDAGDGNGFVPITSQADLNKIIDERLRRERAKFADHAELKAKAEQFDALQAKNQTEAEQSAARLAKLEKDLSDSKSESLRWRIAAKHKISDEDAELFLLGTDEETLEKQAARLATRDSAQRKNSNVVPREGTTTTGSGENPLREFARNLFQPEGADS